MSLILTLVAARDAALLTDATVARVRDAARAGAPVATPLAWEELDDAGLHPRRWTLATIPDRLAGGGDPWRAIARDAAPLP